MTLRETIDALCLERIGRAPNLDRPTSFNDKIQWLKLHDQRPEQITACDKWAVRDMVAQLAGADVLVPARLGIAPDWMPCVVKCTHDSGSAKLARNPEERARALQSAERRLAKPYGVEKGEWAYQFVPPRIFTEMALADPADYKFQFSHGELRWVRVIRDRRTARPRETILAPDGSVLPLHMDQKMVPDPDPAAFPGREAWASLTALAATLAAPWRCVRVDLYWSDDQPWFGELTFWPMAGCYTTPDEPTFGDMLVLDTSQKLEPIVR